MLSKSPAIRQSGSTLSTNEQSTHVDIKLIHQAELEQRPVEASTALHHEPLYAPLIKLSHQISQIDLLSAALSVLNGANYYLAFLRKLFQPATRSRACGSDETLRPQNMR
jgi:hypothetical protein